MSHLIEKKISENLDHAFVLMNQFDESEELNEMIQVSNMYSTLCCTIGDQFSYYVNNYNILKLSRRYEISKAYLGYKSNVSEKITDKQAMTKAEYNNHDIQKMETEREGQVHRLEVFLKGANNKQAMMRTRISFLKKEYENITNQN